MLKPVFSAYGSLDSCSIFKKVASSSVTNVFEGGYLGILKNAAPNIPEVDIATNAQQQGAINDPTTNFGKNYPVFGLIDDSTTGSGYGTLFGSVQPSAGTATVIGPATHAASGRIGLWINPGIFITDKFDPGLKDAYGEAAVDVGTPLYFDSTNLYWTNTLPSANQKPLATFLAILEDASDLLMPMVQPLPGGQAYLLFKFKY